jgi:hypothetical protein
MNKKMFDDFCLFLKFCSPNIQSMNFYHILTLHTSVVIRRGSCPSPHRWPVKWEKPPWGALGPALQ